MATEQREDVLQDLGVQHRIQMLHPELRIPGPIQRMTIYSMAHHADIEVEVDAWETVLSFFGFFSDAVSEDSLRERYKVILQSSESQRYTAAEVSADRFIEQMALRGTQDSVAVRIFYVKAYLAYVDHWLKELGRGRG